jgi:UDP-N-acetylmuramoyl-L-alanyl-D-glutamate--2,6-diaminopimelate ligase
MSRPIEEFKRTLESVAAIANAQLTGDPTTVITGITLSSNSVQEGDLFIALPGEKTHGAEFATDAIARGATAVLTDAAGAAKISGVPVIVSSNPRRAAGVISAWFYSEPMRDLYSVGVTGTNGKTTVTTLLHQIMSLAGRESGLIGTVETRIGEEVIASKRTTPESSDLQALSAMMRERHMRNLVMEVSSHAIALERIRGSHFAVVAFTNLSQDHLDFHRDLEDYFRAKTLLIEKHLKVGSPCFIPAYEEELFAKLKNYPGTHKTKTLIERKIETLPLFFMSHFNKSNLEVAWDICEYLWKKKMQPDLFKFKMTEGRFSIFAHENKKIIIDFAHTPDALKNICEATRLAFPDSKIHLVFGCGGNRDKGKRPQMGKIAEDMANYVYVTSDNPRHEKPEEIIQDIIQGMTHKNHQVIVKREEAIKAAFNNLHDQDVLIIAGKGHENYQIIGDLKLEYTDQAVVDKLIKGKHV